MSLLCTLTLLAGLCLSCVSSFPHHAIHQQRLELKKLQCEPKPVVVPIKDYLQWHDALADKDYFPKVIAVNRCLENCGFCGSSHFGVSTGPCLPDPEGIEQRSVYVYYYDGPEKKFQEVLVEEHTGCTCRK